MIVIHSYVINIYRAFPEYYQAIANPTDLTTIKKKISFKGFNTVHDALVEIRRVWDNCRIFNAEGSEIFNAADTLADYTEQLIQVSETSIIIFILFANLSNWFMNELG
jgi:hypothetical protein